MLSNDIDKGRYQKLDPREGVKLMSKLQLKESIKESVMKNILEKRICVYIFPERSVTTVAGKGIVILPSSIDIKELKGMSEDSINEIVMVSLGLK